MTTPLRARRPFSGSQRDRSPAEHVRLYLWTVRYLRPRQIVHRVKLRLQRAIDPRLLPLLERWHRTHLGTPGWPSEFAPLDRDLADGTPAVEADGSIRFEFLRAPATVRLSGPDAWSAESMSQLWRFHMHYWEWAWGLMNAAEPPSGDDELVRLWQTWRDSCPLGRGDAWSPYVVSLRAWVLCDLAGVLDSDARDSGAFLCELGSHHRFLKRHLELDVGGNHLIKNLKGLVGTSVYLGDRPTLQRACSMLGDQAAVQVLGDGGHYELSPAYHCQVLGDLIDVEGLLQCAGRQSIPGLDDAITRMRAWLGSMRLPDGDVPLFNDAVKVGSERVAALEPSDDEHRAITVLADSGYVVLRPDERTILVMDVGQPCPDELPAHTHADCLSFELWIDGSQVVADTGVSEYGSGPRRGYERSTSAHNTVEIDGENQTEVWAAFRAGRRARPTVHAIEQNEDELRVVASHDGYRRLRPPATHRRTLTVRPRGLEICDDVLGGGNRATSRLHFPLRPDGGVEPIDGGLRIGRLEVTSDRPLRSEDSTVAASFGTLDPAITVSAEAQAPAQIRFHVRW